MSRPSFATEGRDSEVYKKAALKLLQALDEKRCMRHCVESCGGDVTVWSHEGEGSTFTIDLPEDTAEPAVTGNEPTQPATEGRS